MEETLIQEPNWIVLTIIGTVIGYLFPYIVSGISFIWRLLFAKHYLTGQWNNYYQIWENNLPALKHEKWKVETGFNSRLKVSISTTLTDGALSYTGELIEERGHLVAILRAAEYEERAFNRYPIPVPGNASTVVGLYLGVDFNGRATVGTTVLSRVELQAEQLIVLMDKATEVDPNNEMIRLKY